MYNTRVTVLFDHWSYAKHQNDLNTWTLIPGQKHAENSVLGIRCLYYFCPIVILLPYVLLECYLSLIELIIQRCYTLKMKCLSIEVCWLKAISAPYQIHYCSDAQNIRTIYDYCSS